jgi:cyclopropane-fatty-acyl-phospholipid synthase
MADQGDIQVSYDAMEALWINSMRRKFGSDVALDFTGARYNGDYTRGYEEAQADKRNYVLEEIGLKKGDRVLDIGCGWGNMLTEIEERGASCIGLTLSPAHQKYCMVNGWDARLIDWKTYSSLSNETSNLDELTGGELFDAVISIGAFEHFCSVEEFEHGKQDEIYQALFRMVHSCLKPKGKFYLQTMTFGDRGVPDLKKDVDASAPKGSPSRIMAQWKAYFPGSCLPGGEKQIVNAASQLFDLTKSEDGRLDYVETARVWVEAVNSPGGFNKWLEWGKFIWQGRHRPELITRYKAVREDAFSRGFAYNIIGHKRLTFQRNS